MAKKSFPTLNALTVHNKIGLGIYNLGLIHSFVLIKENEIVCDKIWHWAYGQSISLCDDPECCARWITEE
jgi:hypothetical protein